MLLTQVDTVSAKKTPSRNLLIVLLALRRLRRPITQRMGSAEFPISRDLVAPKLPVYTGSQLRKFQRDQKPRTRRSNDQI